VKELYFICFYTSYSTFTICGAVFSRLGPTLIKLVEDATANDKNRTEDHLNGIVINPNRKKAAVYGEFTGYVQQIYLSKLQELQKN
jgi:hypothetical protein